MAGSPIQTWRDGLATGRTPGLKAGGPRQNRESMGRFQTQTDCPERSVMNATLGGQQCAY